jgi:hypothetical protein
LDVCCVGTRAGLVLLEYTYAGVWRIFVFGRKFGVWVLAMAAPEDVNGQQEQLELAVWKKTGCKSLADKRELLFFVGFDCAAAAAASGKKLDK